MDKFFQKCRYWIHHKLKRFEKHIPHYREVIQKFFASKNARLAIILIIAAAIPLTVLGVQQIQDIRQQAKEKNECGPSSYPLRVSKNPANDGEEIKFSHAEEAITQHMFEEEDFTGNGATGCQLTGSVITCKARYNSKSKKAQSDHTYEFRGNKCNYSVLKKVEPTKKPKDPNKPTATKKPRDPNEPTTAPKCEVNLDSENCTGDNKPRLKASWDVGDNDKGCSIKLNGTEISKECQYGNLNIIELGGKDLESDKSYELTVSGGNCSQKASAKAPKCSEKTPAPTAKNGQSPAGAPTGVKTEQISETKMKVSWTKVDDPNVKSYIVQLKDNTGKIIKETAESSASSETVEGLSKDKTYQVSVIAVYKDGSEKGTPFTEAKTGPTPTRKDFASGSATPITTKLTSPESNTAKCSGTKSKPQIVISWSEVAKAESYKLEVKPGVNPAPPVLKKGTTCYLMDVKLNTEYTYKVGANDKADGSGSTQWTSGDKKTCKDSNYQTSGSAAANSFTPAELKCTK